ncbi:glycosyltransferase family 9 protein [Candidatus Woesearchaeota archaeon]|nr:glycosyltransferase family 9 protein [Candidatus Woesearchaeota archaeon]
MGVKLIKFIDKFIGIPLCLFLGVFNSFKKPGTFKKEKPKSILIIQLWGIGETILTIPAIKELKRKYSRASIDILCTARNKDVYLGYRFIRKLIPVNLNPLSLKWFMLKNWKRYDIVIDMEEYLNISAIISFFAGKYPVGYSHGLRSLVYSKKVRYNDRQHTSKTFFDLVRALGVRGTVDRLERLNYPEKDRRTVDSALKNSGIAKKDLIIGIAPGAAESSRSRMWPKKNFAGLIEEICRKKKKCRIILVGANYERCLCQDIIGMVKGKKAAKNTFNMAGKFTLKQTFCLISRCSLFIGNDSGPMHIAAAMGVKTIGLFGPNLPARFSPFNKRSIAIYKKMPCSPCINVHKGQVPECLYPSTGRDYRKCMKAIKVSDVIKYA